MPDIREAIDAALNDVQVIDPHCHLRLARPGADNLAEIVLYHHLWTELVSSGMSPYLVTRAALPHEIADPGIPPLERVRASLAYMPNIRNTTLSLFLRWILADLYDVREPLSLQNLDGLNQLVEAKAKDAQWQEDVLRRRCHIQTSITVAPAGIAYSPRIVKGREGLLSWPGYYAARRQDEWLSALQQEWGQEILDADSYRACAAAAVAALPAAELKFVGLFAPGYINANGATDDAVTRGLRQIKAGQSVELSDMGRLAYAGMVNILTALRGTPVRTIQLIAGVEVLPPSRSITYWGGGFSDAIGRLAIANEDFRFNLSTAADAYTQDVAILAKHMANVSLAGYWWHTFYPYYIRKSLEVRLDMVPYNKIIGFFSDAYHCEWCYPKLKLVKQVLGDLLVERVELGWYDLELARDIISKLFYENPKAIYSV